MPVDPSELFRQIESDMESEYLGNSDSKNDVSSESPEVALDIQLSVPKEEKKREPSRARPAKSAVSPGLSSRIVKVTLPAEEMFLLSSIHRKPIASLVKMMVECYMENTGRKEIRKYLSDLSKQMQ